MINFINLNKNKQKNIIFDKKGKYIVFFQNLSGKFTFELMTSGVEVDIFGLFTGKNSDKFSVETVQHHCAPFTVSNLFIKGVFDDESKLNYWGLIKIEKEAEKSKAYQKNQNLVLSSNAFVEVKPYLEILNDDVICGHGSTISGINKDEMYYLQSRGIGENEAKKLIVDGFANEVIEKVRLEVPEFYV